MLDIINNLNKQNGTAVGIFWMLLTTLLFVIVTCIVRYIGADLPAPVAAFIRYGVGVMILFPTIIKAFSSVSTRRDQVLFAIRGGVHSIAIIFWFFAMARIPIAEVTAIGYTSPLFVTIGAALFLGEKIHMRRLMALVIGLCGIVIILRPGFVEIGSGQLAQLTAAPLFAVSLLMAKNMTTRYASTEIVAMLTFFCTLFLLPAAIYEWRTPTIEEASWLSLTAIIATMGHYTMTQAFKAAPIAVTQPISLLQLVWASILGILLFAEPLDFYVVLGGTTIVAAASYIAWREAMLDRKKSNNTVPQ